MYYNHNTVIQILSQNYQEIHNKSASNTVIIDDIEHKIYYNTSSSSKKHLHLLLDKKFRPFALKLIKNELRELSKLHGFEYNRVSIKNQRSRFGSCSSLGNLNFNWQIILFPQEVFRHVLLHELTHLKIKNHKHEFYNQLIEYDPDALKHNRWLKKEGTKHFLVNKNLPFLRGVPRRGVGFLHFQNNRTMIRTKNLRQYKSLFDLFR